MSCCEPFVIELAGTDTGGGGGGASTDQVFRYEATGAEGTSFTVSLPAARASVDYAVFVSMGDAAAALAIRLPATGRTVNDFPVEVSSAPTAGDVFEFLVKDLS